VLAAQSQWRVLFSAPLDVAVNLQLEMHGFELITIMHRHTDSLVLILNYVAGIEPAWWMCSDYGRLKGDESVVCIYIARCNNLLAPQAQRR
jgi:hypothetical protein